MHKRSALTTGAAALLLAVIVVAGCASTEVTERQRYEGAQLARPDRIIVYDFTANPADVPPEFGVRRANRRRATPTPQQLELGRKLGAQVAKELVADLQGMGLPAVLAAGQPPPQVDDIVLRGYFVSVDEGSAGKRVLVGFGSGAAELRTAVEGYQMTAQGLRPLGRGEVKSGGGELPGMVLPLAVVAATANPIGLVVGGAVEGDRRGHRLGHHRRRRRAHRRRDRGAAADGRRGAGLDLVDAAHGGKHHQRERTIKAGSGEYIRRTRRMSEDLESVAATLVADGKGILAADESVATLTRRFDTVRDPVHRAEPARVPRDAVHHARRGRVHQRRHPVRRDHPSEELRRDAARRGPLDARASFPASRSIPAQSLSPAPPRRPSPRGWTGCGIASRSTTAWAPASRNGGR